MTDKLLSVGSDLNVEHIKNRIQVLACTGCHGFVKNDFTNVHLGGSLVNFNSKETGLEFLSPDLDESGERYIVKPEIRHTFLPERKAILEEFLAGNGSHLLAIESFEQSVTWANTGDLWVRQSGATPTGSTGPNIAATNSAFYLYLDTTTGGADSQGDTAILESTQFPASGCGFKLRVPYVWCWYGGSICRCFGRSAMDKYLDSAGATTRF